MQRREKQKDAKRQGVVIENLSGDMASCKLDDEEESLLDMSQTERQIKRRDSSKSFKTSRGYDRDFKNNATGDLSEGTPERLTGITRVQSSIKVDSPNRFYSLNSKQVTGASDNNATAKPLFQRRQISSQSVECPKDRSEFYRVFSQLINMGSEKKKDKEMFQRQVSSEQLMWQNKVNDVIWLGLQAWFRDVSPEEQDQYIMEARNNADLILNEIMDFRINLDDEDYHNQSDHLEPGSPEYGRHPSLDFGRAYSAHQMLDLSQTLEKHREAMRQVSDILDKLETVERLYPTLKALRLKHPIYAADDFQLRIQTLWLWLNMSRELGHKLKLMAKVLYIDHVQDLEWPWLDDGHEGPNPMNLEQSSPTDCLAEVDEEEEDAVDGIGDNDHQNKGNDSGIHTLLDHDKQATSKSVRFDVGYLSDSSSPSVSQHAPDISLSGPSDSSTPQRPVTFRSLSHSSHTSHASTMSRSNSTMSVEELSHLSIYRYYADR